LDIPVFERYKVYRGMIDAGEMPELRNFDEMFTVVEDFSP
jgi:hypothetical protein